MRTDVWLGGQQDETERELEQMYRQETHVEMELLKDETVGKADLIAPQRNLGALASLHRSVVCTIVFYVLTYGLTLRVWNSRGSARSSTG